jgi:hypothetical protein
MEGEILKKVKKVLREHREELREKYGVKKSVSSAPMLGVRTKSQATSMFL